MALFIVFRCDGSADLGVGHVMRCLTLADALEQNGHECAFCVNDQALALVPQLQGRRVACLPTGRTGPADALEAVAATWPNGADWLVVDHYGYDRAGETLFRPWARNIMVIDDLANRPHDCDILLDQTVGRAEADYKGLVPDAAQVLVSSRYALLRPRFSGLRDAALQRRQQAGPPKKLLISLGGGFGGQELFDTVLDGVTRAGLGLAVDLVLGHGAPDDLVAGLKRKKQTFPLNVLTGVEDMASLMADADVAVGAAGTTSWERCCLGLPTVMVILADNQEMIAHELADREAALLAGRYPGLQAAAVADALRDMCEDIARLREISASAASICDGNGGQRVVGAMTGAGA